MLLEFSVENFRSFASEQKLSMSAGRFRSDRLGVVLDSGARNVPHVLRTVGILGANGAGKSSLIRAFEFVRSFVKNSASAGQKGDKINVIPFKLDLEFRDKPCHFEISFIFESIEYIYNFAVSKTRVERECLVTRIKNVGLKEIFSRHIGDDGLYKWNLNGLPKGTSRLWQRSTRDNALFLSTAVQLNSKEMAKPFEWITDYLRVIEAEDFVSPSFTSHLIKDHVDDGCSTSVLNLLREADLGIRDVQIDEEDFDEASLPEGMPDEIRKSIIADLKGETIYSTKFVHRDRQLSKVLFDLDEESDGTQRLYAMAGPIIGAIEHNETIIIDELEKSLHPLLTRLIIHLFQYPSNKDSTAQLIFTTHDEGLLDAGLLERDQFWLVDKRRGASELVALNDFKPRKSEAMRLNYLKGRYGAVPAISRVKA